MSDGTAGLVFMHCGRDQGAPTCMQCDASIEGIPSPSHYFGSFASWVSAGRPTAAELQRVSFGK